MFGYTGSGGGMSRQRLGRLLTSPWTVAHKEEWPILTCSGLRNPEVKSVVAWNQNTQCGSGQYYINSVAFFSTDKNWADPWGVTQEYRTCLTYTSPSV